MTRLFLLILPLGYVMHVSAQNVPSDPTVYQLPEMNKVIVKQNIVFKKENDTSLMLDIYYPPSFNFKTRLPVIIFNNGVGSMTIPQWRVYKDWAKLMAAKGFIAV